MRGHLRIVGLGLLLSCVTGLIVAQAQSAQDLFQQARGREDLGDCGGAIKIYDRIVRGSSSDAALVARAKLRIGDCLTKLGQPGGLDYFNDVINNYKEQRDVVAEATRLAARTRFPAWDERDFLLIAEFNNGTGDPIFDNSLRAALILQLQPSPYLDIFPDSRVRETLGRLRRPQDERVTHVVAHEICEKAGVKGSLVPSIEAAKDRYTITLSVSNCSTKKESIAQIKVEDVSHGELLANLTAAATKLRAALGESAASISRFPPPTITTSSLAALEAYSRAYKQYQAGVWYSVDIALGNAIKLDPNFASAYALRARMPVSADFNRRYATEAFRLRDRVSEKERMVIEAIYESAALGDVDKSIETLERVRDLYPRDAEIRSLLGNQYRLRGYFEKALKELQESVHLNPVNSLARESLIRNYMSLNRYAEAKALYKEAVAQEADSSSGMHRAVYAIAVAEGDAVAAEREIIWLDVRGGPYQQEMFMVKFQGAELVGDRVGARRIREQQLRILSRTTPATRAATLANEARSEALFGDLDAARFFAQRTLEQMKTPSQLATALIVHGLIGDETNVNALTEEIKNHYSADTFLNRVFVPTALAALEIRKNRGDEAVRLLEPASAYEPSANSMWAVYVRGLAYLQSNSGRAAEAEFQKIIAHRGVDPLSPLYPIALMRLAEARTIAGDKTTARKSYEDFFKLWRNADPEIPVLKEAKAKYEMLTAD